MTIQWTAIGSIGSALAVVVAVVALVRESRASRFVVGIEMIMRLNDQFESDAFRKTRRLPRCTYGTEQPATPPALRPCTIF